jgi:hypothetical protein
MTCQSHNCHGVVDPFYSTLLIQVLLDNPCHIADDEVLQDVEYASRRLMSEGLPFVTKLLPLFAKAAETGLETGQYKVPAGFKASKRNPGLPAFLQDVLLAVFDSDGVLRPEIMTHVSANHVDGAASTSVEELDRVAVAVRHVRQVGYLFYKLDLPYPEQVEQEALARFVQVEDELPEPDGPVSGGDELLDIVAYEMTRLLGEVDLVNIIPRHGPGAVSTGEKGDSKWTFSRTYDNLTPVYGLSYFTVGGHDEVTDRREWVRQLSHWDTGLCKLLFVLKDSRGPRTICPHPLEFQWIAQGQARAITPHVEAISEYRINFRDQTTNGSLALRSSLTRDNATLDMKEASDWVSLAQMRRVLPSSVMRYLEATRCEALQLPNGEAIVLRKFAPMGSAVCFPVEACFFWSVAVAAISLVLPGRRRWVRQHVYAFGDDLIVPREYAHVVIDGLEAVGLKVNRSKSFVTGFFRESCGVDAFVGRNVTPVRIKKSVRAGGPLGSYLLSWADYAHSLEEHGYPRASESLYAAIEAITGPLPYGTSDAGYLCRRTNTWSSAVSRNYKLAKRRKLRIRLDQDFQNVEVKALAVPTARTETTSVDGWERLLRNLTQGAGRRPDVVALQTNDEGPLVYRWNRV